MPLRFTFGLRVRFSVSGRLRIMVRVTVKVRVRARLGRWPDLQLVLVFGRSIYNEYSRYIYITGTCLGIRSVQARLLFLLQS